MTRVNFRSLGLIAVTATLALVAADRQPTMAVSEMGCLACSGGSIVGCASGSHKAWTDDDDAVYADYSSAHDDCRYGSCSTSHGHCSLDNELLIAALDEAVASGDAERIARILTGEPRATINSARSSVQVTGCAGALVANLVMPADLAVRAGALAAH